MNMLKIYKEEGLLIKYYVIKHLILLKLIDANMDLLQSFIIFDNKFDTRSNKSSGATGANKCATHRNNSF